MRIRLKDVAEHAGVSIAAASMALKGSSRISPATIKRVTSTARRLGYQPDAAAQALARSGNRSEHGAFYGTLGVLTNRWALNPDTQPEEVSKTWTTALNSAAAELGYALDHFRLPGTKAEASATLRQLRARNIRGLVVEACNLAIPDVGFDWSQFSTMVVSPPPGEVPFHRINAHSLTETYAAVRRCHQRGYRRIGLVVDPYRFADWQGGYIAATAVLGLKDSPSILPMPEWDEAKFLAWFERERPDAIIANEDRRPLAALAARGLRAPDHFGYCCLDVFDVQGDLTGFLVMRHVRNRLAVEMLHGFLRRQEFGLPAVPLTLEVACQWIDGRTLRPAAPP